MVSGSGQSTAAGAGPATDAVYAVPVEAAVPEVIMGQPLPLIDADRQSLIVRLDGRDCRVSVWWQPFDGAWYGGIEVPVNTQIVRGRRLVTDSGLLDRIEGVLAGNLDVPCPRRRLCAGGSRPHRVGAVSPMRWCGSLPSSPPLAPGCSRLQTRAHRRHTGRLSGRSWRSRPSR